MNGIKRDIIHDLERQSSRALRSWLSRGLYSLLTLAVPALTAGIIYSQIHSSLAASNLSSLLSASLVAITYWLTGLILLIRRFEQQVSRLFFLLTQCVAIALLPPLAYPVSLPMPAWLIPLNVIRFQLVGPVLLHYSMTFPVRLGNPRQRRLVLTTAYVLGVASVLCRFLGLDPTTLVTGLYNTLVTLLAIAIPLYVYVKRATPNDRRRIRLVTFGLAASIAPSIFLYFLPRGFHASYQIPEWLASLFMGIAPVCYLYAFTQYHLFDIDRLLNRTLVYVFLTAGILAFYLAPLVYLYNVLPGEWLVQAVLLAGLTLLVGWNFSWLRLRVERLVDRLFYGGWYSYPGVVDTISDALASSLDRAQVTEVLSRRVPKLMQLQEGTLSIGDPVEGPAPEQPFPSLVFTFSLQGGLKASWRVAGHVNGEGFSTEDRRILKTLAKEAEIALNNVALFEALRSQILDIRTSHETLAELERELLRSREEERSRLARDLHDGPIQTLVGISMQLGVLMGDHTDRKANELTMLPEMSAPQPQKILEEMQVEIRGLLTELRQVCAQLRPPMLDMLGLSAAIRSLAAEWEEQSGIPVQMDLQPDPGLHTLPDEVALNLYRVAQEALANIAHHAAAGSVSLRYRYQTGRLSLRIQDDGRGFEPGKTLPGAPACGHFGLAGIRERVDLIGGIFDLRSAPGAGTTLSVDWQDPHSIRIKPS